MGKKLALCVVSTVLLIGCGDDLASLYEDEGYAGTFEQEQGPASVLRATALQDTAPPERIPAAPLVATQPPQTRRRSLRLLCSPSAKSLFGDILEKPFEQAYPGIDLVLLEEQDRACIGNVIMKNGAAAIVGVPLSPNENQHRLVVKVLGYYIVVAIVHRNNTVTSLFDGPLRKVLDGRIGNWGELGWQNLQIQPVYEAPVRRDDPAAKLLQMTDKAAQIAVLLPNGDRVMDYVSREPRALGLVTLTRLKSRRGGVRYLQINTVRPTVANYLRGAYPLGCTFRLVHTMDRQSELAELLRFLRGNEARRLLEPHLTLP